MLDSHMGVGVPCTDAQEPFVGVKLQTLAKCVYGRHFLCVLDTHQMVLLMRPCGSQCTNLHGNQSPMQDVSEEEIDAPVQRSSSKASVQSVGSKGSSFLRLARLRALFMGSKST
jgi:hypothetical protein